MTRVAVGARLHFGFCNLSLARERLYGAVGAGIARPRTVVTAEPAGSIVCDHPVVLEHVRTTVELLDVPGAEVTVEETLPRHAGLGSGTRLALATLTAVANAYDRAPRVRERAPVLGRGGRSGVGVATFDAGRFVLDAGQPTAQFTTDRPADGEWTVPPVLARHEIPSNWRFVLLIPDVDAGRSGPQEDRSMRGAIQQASPEPADRIAGIVLRQLLPAIAERSVERFGEAVAEIGRLNGAWYADEQGGTFRPPAGDLITALSDAPSIYGAGQSSWGPIVYGITDVDRASAAESAGQAALEAADVDGAVRVVEGDNHGAYVEDE